MFGIVDRLEIFNVISLYSHSFDEGQAEAWADLFTNDAVFTTQLKFAMGGSSPGPTEVRGREALLDVARSWRQEHRPDFGQARHLITNLAILEQTEESSDVAAFAGLVVTGPDGETAFFSPGRYTGTLVKRPTSWKIHRWHFDWDADADKNLGRHWEF